MLNITAYAMRKSLPARIGRTSGHHRHREPRQGSALMIVLVLMGMLSILGVLFYTFSAQERSNAEYYSEAAKASPVSTNLDADTLFDWGLDQIIVGTDGRLKNSMLWGSRYSLLSNSLGFGVHRPGDTQPFNGEGINLIKLPWIKIEMGFPMMGRAVSLTTDICSILLTPRRRRNNLIPANGS